MHNRPTSEKTTRRKISFASPITVTVIDKDPVIEKDTKDRSGYQSYHRYQGGGGYGFCSQGSQRHGSGYGR